MRMLFRPAGLPGADRLLPFEDALSPLLLFFSLSPPPPPGQRLARFLVCFYALTFHLVSGVAQEARERETVASTHPGTATSPGSPPDKPALPHNVEISPPPIFRTLRTSCGVSCKRGGGTFLQDFLQGGSRIKGGRGEKLS